MKYLFKKIVIYNVVILYLGRSNISQTVFTIDFIKMLYWEEISLQLYKCNSHLNEPFNECFSSLI